jgi:L-aminopeptidase/D-esterase-like protein
MKGRLPDGLGERKQKSESNAKANQHVEQTPGEVRAVRSAAVQFGNYLFQAMACGIPVVATDLPVTPLQLGRICKRAALGIGRVGTYAAHGSGEIILGFSTANTIPSISTAKFQMTVVNDPFLDPAYEAVIEATEEAILNSLFRATTVTGRDGHRRDALPIEETVEIMRRYGHEGVRGV